jgi:hypothetical protein
MSCSGLTTSTLQIRDLQEAADTRNMFLNGKQAAAHATNIRSDIYRDITKKGVYF